jgi:hypothetical protein
MERKRIFVVQEWGDVASLAHHEEPLAVVWQTEVVWRQETGAGLGDSSVSGEPYLVAQLNFKDVPDTLPGVTCVVTLKVADVLQKDIRRPPVLQDDSQHLEHSSVQVGKASLST